MSILHLVITIPIIQPSSSPLRIYIPPLRPPRIHKGAVAAPVLYLVEAMVVLNLLLATEEKIGVLRVDARRDGMLGRIGHGRWRS